VVVVAITTKTTLSNGYQGLFPWG